MKYSNMKLNIYFDIFKAVSSEKTIWIYQNKANYEILYVRNITYLL